MGNFDHSQEAKDKLDVIKKTDAATKYTVEFKKWRFRSGYDEAALKNLYYKGLNSDVKDTMAISPVDPPQALNDYQDYCIKIDNRLYKRKKEKKGANSRYHKDEASDDRMDVDSTDFKKRKKLTEAQKEYRRKNNLCLYCGDSHKLEDCEKDTLPSRKTSNLTSSLVDLPTSIFSYKTGANFIPKKVIFEGTIGKNPVNCFLDNGCSVLALMDYSYAYLLGVTLEPLAKKIPVYLSDGSRSKFPVQFVTEPVKLTIGNHTETIRYYVTKVDNYDTVLGLPWLNLHNPQVNWRDLSIIFNDSYCKDHNCLSKDEEPSPVYSTQGLKEQ
eukprot:Pgem_evm1s5808